MLLSALSGPIINVAASPPRATSPTLGASLSYSVLAGSIVTNTGASTMPGDLGISPSIGVPPHFTGFPPGIVGPPGAIHDADANAAAAQADNTAAFTALDQGCDTTYPGVQDLTLVSPLGPGVYCADAFILTGSLTLSETVGVYIFKSASTLTTSSDSSITGGDPCNVWWRLVSSGVLGTGTDFLGNILALTSISLATGASVNGRVMAQVGAVTLDTNTFSSPPCALQITSTPTSTATGTATETGTPTTTPTPTITNTPQAPQNTNTPTPTITNSPQAPQNTNTPVPPSTDTPLPAPTATATAPAVVGLPATGGGPLPVAGFPWSSVAVAGGLGVLALGLLGAYRRTRRAAR